MKMEWITISHKTGTGITRIADTIIKPPIGATLVNHNGETGWNGNNPELKNHDGSLRT